MKNIKGTNEIREILVIWRPEMLNIREGYSITKHFVIFLETVRKTADF